MARVRSKSVERFNLRICLLALGLFLSSLVSVETAQSALACTAPPENPIIKTIWNKSGGPLFTAVGNPAGDLPNKLSYTYSYKKTSDKDFGEWSEWIDTDTTSFEEQIEFQSSLKQGYDWVAFSANAINECGNRFLTVSRRLVSYQKLSIAKSQIAEDLPLAAGKIPIYFFSPDGYEIPQTLTSKNPGVCEFDLKAKTLELIAPGKCEVTISQNNEELQTPHPDVTRTYNILKPRALISSATKDRRDDFTGSQIHVVYVALSGVPSRGLDSRGDISNWLDLANIWMKKKLGKEFAFDTYNGSYDVSFMKSSVSAKDIAAKDLLNPKSKIKGITILDRLRNEFVKQAGSAVSKKYLLFVVDAAMSKSYCGLGQQPGRIAMATPRGDCWDPTKGYLAQITKLNSPSATIAHELIHNTGVGHPCGQQSDLMIGSGCKLSSSPIEITLDAQRKLYVGTSKAGANILKAKFWKK